MRDWIRSRTGSGGHGVSLPPVAGVAAEDPVLSYADDQIRWYDSNSRRSMNYHYALRSAQLFFAALVPVSQIPPSAVGWRVAAARSAASSRFVRGSTRCTTTASTT